MTTLDYAVVFLWLLATLGAGIWAGLRASAGAYWVNNRSTSATSLVLTVVATQVGAGAIIGLAAATQSSGTGYAVVSLASTVFGFLAMAYFAPRVKKFGDKFQAITLPEIFGRRYGRRVQVAAAVVILFTYVSLLAAQFQASSTLVTVFGGLEMKWAVGVATLGVIFYSAFAGLRGDIVTDAMHFFAMLFVLLLVALPALVLKYDGAALGFGLPPQIQSPVTFGGWTFLVMGLLFGAIIPLLAPELWMKVFASKTAQESRRVFVVASLLVIPFYLFAVVLGFATVTSHTTGKTPEDAVLRTLLGILPVGLTGFAVASVLSVILSTANTLVVVITATVLRDFFGIDSSSDVNLKKARGLSVVAGLLGAALAFFTGDLVQLLLNTFYGLLALAAPLVGAVFWRRATATGAMWSIALGFGTTLVGLFFIPKQAFLPGLLTSVLAFVLVSKFSKHGVAELEEPSALFD
jgi:SSS family solute:Na+ symporter